MTKWLALSLGEEVLAFYDHEFEAMVISDPGLSELTQANSRKLLKLLRAWRGTGRTIFCWDGMRTVWPWLAKKTGQEAQVAYEAKQSVDCTFSIYWKMGYTAGLDLVCEGLCIEMETDWTDIVLKPEMYPDETGTKYLAYELTNVHAAYQIAVESEDQGVLSWVARSGKHKAIDLGVKWPTVGEVMEMERIEPGWIEDPIQPEGFLGWMP